MLCSNSIPHKGVKPVSLSCTQGIRELLLSTPPLTCAVWLWRNVTDLLLLLSIPINVGLFWCEDVQSKWDSLIFPT